MRRARWMVSLSSCWRRSGFAWAKIDAANSFCRGAMTLQGLRI
jgi:hypothetical protein